MLKIPRSPLDAHRLFNDVVTDEDYEKNKQHHDLHHAFTTTALALVEMGTSDSGNRTKSADQLYVAANLGNYIEAVDALDAAKEGNKLSYRERKQFVRDTVVFNHALETMIDYDQATTYGEVRDFLMGLYNNLYKDATPTDRASAKSHFEQTLTGMTHEIFGEQLAGYLGYEVDGVTVEDDMKGIDRYLAINGEWHGVDFKSNSAEANRARTKHPENFILATGIPDYVAGGKMRLSPEDVARYAPFFQQELDREWQRLGSVVQ